MKMLVIGIDGGDKRIIDAMDMPFLQSLLSERVCLKVEEDLWSRGWAEILSGVHGRGASHFRENRARGENRGVAPEKTHHDTRRPKAIGILYGRNCRDFVPQ